MMLYALCGLSGAGKTTLLEATLHRKPELARLITWTTRPCRSGETPGRDYHFVTAEQFLSTVQAGYLVCPIQYRGAWYGTGLADLHACCEQDTLGVLRPDKLAALSIYTPLIGVYVEMQGQERPTSSEDRVIDEHQHRCAYHIANVLGDLDQAVTHLLSLIERE